MPSAHSAEQNHTNAMILDSGLPFTILDRRCNWQHWTDADFKTAPPDAILHWSGCWGEKRVKQIGEWASRHPLLKLPSPSHPGWEMDARHVRRIYHELLNRQYSSVLEIGCYRGYSTRALLAAAKAGCVETVHLCDVAIRPELLEVVAEYDLGERVTLHPEPSTNVLAKVAADLVVIDGDHTLPTCSHEAAMILASSTKAIFAHDTNATAAGYECCEGPAHIKTVLREAGWRCVEDCETREGERTQRGLLFAVRP